MLTFIATNYQYFQWNYMDVISMKPAAKGDTNSKQDEFVVQMKVKKKSDNMRFSSDYTSTILTDALKYANRNRLSDNMVCDLS
jgi:hypothetical protein